MTLPLNSIEDQAAAAAQACRAALAKPELAGLRGRLHGVPHDAKGWFELLRGFPHGAESYATLTALQKALPPDAVAAGVSAGHYAALNALSVAATRIAQEPLPVSVKQLYINFVHQIAVRARHWEEHFDVEGPRFHDLAHLASLRRFPAGEVAFQVQSRLPPFFGLRIHPLDWPGVLTAVACGMGGIGPIATLHFNYARENWLVVPQAEFERSLWRVANALEYHPQVKALVSVSWFHSPLVGEAFPRLAWMRGVFTDGGAYAVDLEPGREADICYNSAKRRQLYDQGKFCPRQTLVIWPRDALLAWAARRPELTDESEQPLVAPPRADRRIRVKPGRPRRMAKHNSPVTLWDGKPLYVRSGSRYALLVLILPAIAAAVCAMLAIGGLAAIPAFFVALVAAYVFQYYLFQ